MEGIGLAPGAAPPPILKPPPVFPLLERKPLKLREDELTEYLYSIKQEYRQYMQQSPFHLRSETNKSSIHRYSDKYFKSKDNQNGKSLPWAVDWNFFPKELQLHKPKKIVKSKSSKVKKKLRKRSLDSGSDVETPKKKRKVTFAEEEGGETPQGKEGDVMTKLKDLEKKEGETSGEEDEVPGSGDEEFYDEEIEEEGTDYNQSYFDNGEDFIEEDNLEDNEGPYY